MAEDSPHFVNPSRGRTSDLGVNWKGVRVVHFQISRKQNLYILRAFGKSITGTRRTHSLRNKTAKHSIKIIGESIETEPRDHLRKPSGTKHDYDKIQKNAP